MIILKILKSMLTKGVVCYKKIILTLCKHVMHKANPRNKVGVEITIKIAD